VSSGDRFAGRVALVTGASRGQGQSHAIRLAQEGADVIVTDLLPDDPVTDGFAETVGHVQELGRRVVARSADVRDEVALRGVVDAGVAELGRLDVVVANAGVVSIAPSLDASPESWQLALDVNLTGVWHTCRASLPHLIAGGRGGSIVITGSTQAFKATPRVAAYATSKHGTIGLMKTLAIEFAEHMIRVNSVHPTTVRTPMLAQISPDGLTEEELVEHYRHVNALPVPWVESIDVSNAIAFLASDEARYINGVALPVDAGALLVGGRAG
jgi:SDR family mycofactocin-dependent oxidoreductase